LAIALISKFSPKPPRQLAWELLFEVENSNLYSNIVLPKALGESGYEKRDKGLVTELVYGTLRMRGFCDSAIRIHLDRKLEDLDLKVLTTLRMGAYQLLVMRMPAHAAVDETVELAKIVSGKSAASFVNAIMRRISENPDHNPEKLEDRYSHPTWIINALRDALGNDELVAAQLEADNEIANPTLIPWPDRATTEELQEAGAEQIPGSLRAFSYKGSPGEIAAIRERRAGVQDLGSQIVVEKFYETHEPNLRWLDLCAGPGGKAAYLDSLIGNGEFIANEPGKERARLVEQVVRRAKITSFDGREIPNEVGTFDRILIDAPCTGIGALRRRPEVRWRRKATDLRALLALQGELLASAAAKLKVSGIIGYATCSPHLAETKLQVTDFLKRHQNFERISVGSRADSDGDLQLWTFKDGTDCMFLSLLKRNS
jgi:16S rRNA (cytosine967-C5)-methyltransferase